MQDAGGELSRTTVRLFNELKSQAERAASEQGVSLNTYISRAVSDSVRSAVPNKGNRVAAGVTAAQRHRILPRLSPTAERRSRQRLSTLQPQHVSPPIQHR